MTIRRSLHLETQARHLLFRAIYSQLARWRLRIRGARVGAGFRCYGWLNLHVHDTAQVIIGDHVRINSGFALNPVGGSQRTGIWVGRNAVLRIEDHVGISNCTIVCANRVHIESHVFVGGGVSIYDTDFHALAARSRVEHDPSATRTAPVVVGSRSFIGGHAIILKGSSIGAEAIIGAGALVAGTVPAGEVWAGNPARFVKKIQPAAQYSAEMMQAQGQAGE